MIKALIISLFFIAANSFSMSPFRVRIKDQDYTLPQEVISLIEGEYLDLQISGDCNPVTITVDDQMEVMIESSSKDLETVLYQENQEIINPLFRLLSDLAEVLKSAGEVEMIDWYSEPSEENSNDGEIVCSLPRSFVHDHNLMHKGIGLCILSHNKERIFMHKRSCSKRTWPGLLDSLLGGLMNSGESSLETAKREMLEELGLEVGEDDDTRIEFVGTTLITTIQNRCYVDTYLVTLDEGMEGAVSYPDGEVEWGRWVPLNEMKAMIDRDEEAFVPSGLQVWRYLEREGRV